MYHIFQWSGISSDGSDRGSIGFIDHHIWMTDRFLLSISSDWISFLVLIDFFFCFSRPFWKSGPRFGTCVKKVLHNSSKIGQILHYFIKCFWPDVQAQNIALPKKNRLLFEAQVEPQMSSNLWIIFILKIVSYISVIGDIFWWIRSGEHWLHWISYLNDG